RSVPLQTVPPRAFHRSKHLMVLLFERASRCYELGAPTLDVFPECFEQRDALGSSDESSEAVWFLDYYKAFGGAKPARSKEFERRIRCRNRGFRQLPSRRGPRSRPSTGPTRRI